MTGSEQAPDPAVTPVSDDPIETERRRLAEHWVRPDSTYLLSHSVGLPIVGQRAAVDGALDVWHRRPVDSWPVWLGILDGFRSALARLLGTEPALLCPQSDVSSGLTKFLDATPAGSRRRGAASTLLLSADAFPTVGFVAERTGHRVRFLPDGADALDADAWRNAMDGVDLVVVTHVHSNTGECLPVADITAAARELGVTSIVDVAQSVGIVPIDVAAWSADAIVGSCVKWLSGGPGAGWLWVDDEHLPETSPSDVGWFSHRDPFEFDIHRFEFADDALRFWGGSPTVLPFAAAAHSIETIVGLGVETLRDHNQRLLDRLLDRLGERIVSPHDPTRRGGTAIVAAPATLDAGLAAIGVDVDRRGPSLRLSPHVHTDPDDLDRAAAAIETG